MRIFQTTVAAVQSAVMPRILSSRIDTTAFGGTAYLPMKRDRNISDSRQMTSIA